MTLFQTFSRYLKNWDMDTNADWLLQMSKRPKYQPVRQKTCTICEKPVDSFPRIFVFWSCDHWICLDCYDSQCDYWYGVGKLKYMPFCHICKEVPQYPDDPEREAGAHVILEAKSGLFKKRFSCNPEPEPVSTTPKKRKLFLELDEEEEDRDAGFEIKREKIDELAEIGYRAIHLPTQLLDMQDKLNVVVNHTYNILQRLTDLETKLNESK